MVKAIALAATLALVSTAALAIDPGYYVVNAYGVEGQRSIDFRYWTVKIPGGPATLWPEAGFGLGVTSRWYSELYASYIGSADTAKRLNTVDWQNDLLLTQGQYPFDLALHTLLVEYLRGDGGHAVEIGPALQTEFGKLQVNTNLFFSHDQTAYSSGATELSYQWQLRHHTMPLLQFGLQGFGELGPWNRWLPHDQQSHRAGPALFGSAPTFGSQALSYQAAWLAGKVYGRNAGMFTMRVQYLF